MRITDGKVEPIAVERAEPKGARAASSSDRAPAVVVSLSDRVAAPRGASPSRGLDRRYAERVKEVREQFSAGSYDVDLELLARKLLDQDLGSGGRR